MALHPDVKTVRRNDIIKVNRYSSLVKFITWKGSKFIGVMVDEGTTHKFAAELFNGIVERAPKDMGWKTLEEDEPFYFAHKGMAVVALFKRINGKGQIEAVCPVSEMNWKIFTDSYAGRVKDLLPADELVEA